MRGMKKVLLGLATLGLVAAPHAVLAAPQVCTGLVTGQINGGLVVNSGTCIVNKATVNGGIQVNGGSLYVCDSTVNGLIQGTVSGDGITRIGETDTTGQIGLPPALTSCPGDTVNGGVQLSGVGFTEIEASTINGGVDLTNSSPTTLPSGGEIEGSTIHGPLSCGTGFDNDAGQPNEVTGPDNCPSVN